MFQGSWVILGDLVFFASLFHYTPNKNTWILGLAQSCIRCLPFPGTVLACLDQSALGVSAERKTFGIMDSVLDEMPSCNSFLSFSLCVCA